MVFENNSNEYLSITEIDLTNQINPFDFKKSEKIIVWNTGVNLEITVDRVVYQLYQNEIIFLTEFHKIDDFVIHSARIISFNKPFFCMIDQDQYVGSKGLLFYGALHVPVISLNAQEASYFEGSWQIFKTDIQEKGVLQKEILESTLKRILILSVRILNKSTNLNKLGKGQIEIVREFSYLVENNYQKYHDVGFYANMLNKSPKTLSNIFSNSYKRSPLFIIHDRIMIHAKRQLYYTSLSIKEISYQLGFKDVQTFSRFFKNREGLSPMQYREKNATLK